jgi:hypothetical protein
MRPKFKDEYRIIDSTRQIWHRIKSHLYDDLEDVQMNIMIEKQTVYTTLRSQ